MGTWSVVSVNTSSSALANPFGHDFRVTIRIKYSPSRIGHFVEPPILAWDETIMFNDYGKGQRWEFVGNMYKHKPGSPTVAVWGQRYFRAYLHAAGQPYTDGGRAKGHSKLFNTNGQPVTGAALGNHVGAANQNKAVQDYLKRNGGTLEIEVHDIPGITITPGSTRDLERLLIFNCGVSGMGPRVKAWQHIKINTAQPAATWTRLLQLGSNVPGLKTSGLTVVQDYASVPNPAAAMGAIQET